MRKYIKKILLVVLAAIALYLLFNAGLVIYGIRQLTGQLNIINKAVPIEEYVINELHPKEFRNQLQYLSAVRSYAMDSLGLNASDNYTTFYDHGKKPILWVVTGCRPFQLEAKEWRFPLLGSLSYKGFFREDLALMEATKIRAQGYETDIYNPSAWSTLGIMNDPVLSGMLNRGPGQLAELIIHELTHATIYISGDVDYNENLATFIGESGAIAFLSSHFGENSPEKIRYERVLQDEDTYARHLLHGSERLDSLYQSFPQDISAAEMATMKYRLIADILMGINFLPLHERSRYCYNFRKDPLPGNPFFMAYRRYRKDQSAFKVMLVEQYGGSIVKMIKGLENR